MLPSKWGQIFILDFSMPPYRNGGMNQREIGELMGIDYSAVSVMRKRLSSLQRGDVNGVKSSSLISPIRIY